MTKPKVRIDFQGASKFNGALVEPITVLFEGSAFGFAIGMLRGIPEWNLVSEDWPDMEVYTLERIEVTSNDQSVPTYRVYLHSRIGEKKMTLTASPGASCGECEIWVAEPVSLRIRRGVEALSTGSQRQDSTLDQLRDVHILAVAAGCYDAADIIKKHL